MHAIRSSSKTVPSSRFATRLLVVAALCVSGGNCAAALAGSDTGMLGQFEKSVQPPPAPSAPPPPPRRNPEPAPERAHTCGPDDLDFGCIVADLITEVVGDMSASTMQRLSPGADPAVRRDAGDILLPFVRYDFFHQSVATNVSANNHRLEAGLGPVALLFERYMFREQIPNATLTVERQMFLYRASFSRTIEVDLGVGQTNIYGLQRTTLGTISLPIKIAFNDNFALELRPTKADTMDDYEAALHWGGQYGSLKVGYRTLVGSGASLSGPFAGFAVYY